MPGRSCTIEPVATARISGEPNLAATPILDYDTPAVARFAATVAPDGDSELGFLRGAHCAVSTRITPVYTIRERQAVSTTIKLGVGSCSQRLACLEALARLRGIGTRVRGLWISGAFWNRRFPLTRVFIPRRILLAWPEFRLESGWIGVEEIFGPLTEMAEKSTAFANDGETLFEAVQSTAVDFAGATQGCSPNHCDLSRYVLEACGTFDTRDELFSRFGTLEDTWRGKAFELFYSGRESFSK